MPQRIGQRVSLVDPSQLARIIWATSQLNSLEVVLIITAERVRASASSLLGTKYNCSVRRTAFHSPILMRVIGSPIITQRVLPVPIPFSLVWNPTWQIN